MPSTRKCVGLKGSWSVKSPWEALLLRPEEAPGSGGLEAAPARDPRRPSSWWVETPGGRLGAALARRTPQPGSVCTPRGLQPVGEAVMATAEWLREMQEIDAQQEVRWGARLRAARRHLSGARAAGPAPHGAEEGPGPQAPRELPSAGPPSR